MHAKIIFINIIIPLEEKEYQNILFLDKMDQGYSLQNTNIAYNHTYTEFINAKVKTNADLKVFESFHYTFIS